MNAQKLIALIKQHPLATACALVTLVLLGLMFLRGAALGDAEAQYNQVVSEIDEMDQNEKNSIGLSEDVEKINVLVEDIQSRLMVERARADHYRYFLSLAEASKVTLQDPVFESYLAPGQKNVVIMTEQLAEVTYRLNVRGEFNHVMDFIYQLSSGRYLARVSEMSIEGAPTLGKDMAQASLTVSILAVAPPKPEKKEK
ncbi:MAG: hypothetical protein Q7Q73_12355 [Verrucomicrobiota bacterium JB024]|nr:hypothetical protein [Verrucomicrobiota bacterium JB024]